MQLVQMRTTIYVSESSDRLYIKTVSIGKFRLMCELNEFQIGSEKIYFGN